MSTYAIGDIQGCFKPFMDLLDKIQFEPNKDKLWLTGDLVNRGQHSLETLRFVKGLNNSALTVLGNHDFTLLAVGCEATPYRPDKHTFADILQAPDRDELLDWLRHCPLLHYDSELGYCLVHAGLYPFWDLDLAQTLAKEVEAALQEPNFQSLLKAQYGNLPDRWNDRLTGFDRLRLIINCFTRMRYCSPEGQLEFDTKESTHATPAGYLPWFAIPNPNWNNIKILFGHWASLEGKCATPNRFALDTGCVWGNCLTALRLEDNQWFRVSCKDR